MIDWLMRSEALASVTRSSCCAIAAARSEPPRNRAGKENDGDETAFAGRARC